jgi:hypothetical protein
MSDNRKSDDCCEHEVPEPRYDNPPGQPRLTYRTGQYGESLLRMLSRITTQSVPDGDHRGKRPLAALSTRDQADPSIALMHAWAVCVDVISVYMEQFANEGYLHTATERRSLFEMARAIGYELNPGVAASTYLAFTIDSPPAAPGQATIPKKTPVMSIPPAGKQPQTFETTAEFTGYSAWNELRPRLWRKQHLAIHEERLYLLDLDGTVSGTALPISELYVCSDVTFDPDMTTVHAVEVEQVYVRGTTTSIKEGQVMLLAGKHTVSDSYQTFVKPVLRVEKDPDTNCTRIDLDMDAPPKPFSFVVMPIAYTITAVQSLPFTAASINASVSTATLSNQTLNAMMQVNQWTPQSLTTYLNQPRQIAPLSDNQGVFVFRQQMGFFGSSAPGWSSLPYSQRVGERVVTDNDGGTAWVAGPYGSNWDASSGWQIWKSYPANSDYTTADVYLERESEDVNRNDWIVFEHATNKTFHSYRVGDVRSQSITGFSLSGKATGLLLADEDGNSLTSIDKSSSLTVRTTTAHLASERLILSEMPIGDALESIVEIDSELQPVGALQIMLDELVIDLQPQQPIAIRGEQVDADNVIQHEIGIIRAIDHVRGYTVITLERNLRYRYIRETVTINANVVQATHGESQSELLGGGDGTQPNQRFTLNKPPLTYVSAQTPTGRASTLTVRVNDVAWEQVPALYGLSPTDEAFIVRHEDDGSVHLVFGDGQRGARLPTGQSNITATYRSGIGEDGEVEAGSLAMLSRKPLYVRGVTNPTAASGSESPETLDMARQNAPLTVLTLDRIVSLRDFEDFARAFAGIGKATARVLWTGENDLVHITIASATGKTVAPIDRLYTDLVAAIDAVRDPIQQVRIDTFSLLLFNVTASVLVDDRFIAGDVLSEATAALIAAFTFDTRRFAQPVTASEVIQTIQSVEGVIAVDLDQFYLVTDATGAAQTFPPPLIEAFAARWSDTGALLLAELLLINTTGIDLKEMSA